MNWTVIGVIICIVLGIPFTAWLLERAKKFMN